MASSTSVPTSGDDEKVLPPLGQLKDRHGNTFYFGNAGDYWHPPSPVAGYDNYRDFVRDIRDMHIREDDVIVYSFPKTGSHWHADILHMLRHQTLQASPSNGADVFIDMNTMDNLAALPSPRYLFTHVPFRYFPRQALERNIKILFLDRNPKDVLVSLYNQLKGHQFPMSYPGTFDQFLDINMEVGYWYGNIFDFLMEIQEGLEKYPDANVYTSVFEEMKQNPMEGVVKLNEFLGTGCSRELCEAIADACTFKKLKPVKETAMSEMVKTSFVGGATGFYRKGEIGDWKNWFTVAMNERFDAEFNKRMKGYKRQYIFSK